MMGQGFDAAGDFGGNKTERTGFVHQRQPEESWQLLPADRGELPRVPELDPVYLLPQSAQDRLLRLRFDFQEANGAASAIASDLRFLHSTATDLRDRAAARHYSSVNDAGYRPHAEAAQREADAAEAKFLEAQRRAAASQERRNALGSLLSSVESFVADLRGMKVTEVEPPTFRKIPTDLPAEIETRRRRLREFDADRRRVEVAPLPASEGRAGVRQQIQNLAMPPDIGPLMDARLGKIIFPTTHGRGMGEPEGTLRLLCWLMPDIVAAGLDKLVDEWGDPGDALSDDDRRDKLAQIADDALAIEREESALHDLAEQKGLSIARRADLSPAAYLGIQLSGIKN